MKLSPKVFDDTRKMVRSILVVDGEENTCEALRREVANPLLEFRWAPTPDGALLELGRRSADVVLVNLQINDNGGAELIGQVTRRFPLTEPVALTRSLKFDLCLAAFRAGAKDLIALPADELGIQRCVQGALERATDRNQRAKRQVRLRTVCKKLNKARHEISQQVELLCQDLVSAYQQLADKVHDVPERETGVGVVAAAAPAATKSKAKGAGAGDFADLMENDLDAESLLRKTMEYILKKVGPVNAAAFLPNSEGDFTLGAYLNYDTPSNSMLLDLVSQTIAKEAGRDERPLNLATNAEIKACLGGKQKMLEDRHWIAVGAFHKHECFGAVVIFRSQDELLNRSVEKVLGLVCPILGAQISRVLSVHNRGTDEDGELGDEASEA